MTTGRGVRDTRRINWIKAALKDFQAFPPGTRTRVAEALTAVADGATPDIAKPLTGLGGGVWELAIREQGDAWRVVYGLQIEEDIWVIHALQKKSKSGISTPKSEIDLVRVRIKRLKATVA
jgi:phage-related protein